MAIPSVDLTTLNNLSPNLDIGDIADPALRLQAFQYLYNKLTEAVADLNAFQVGGAIKTVNLADGNVVTVKLADNAVTGPKILDGAIITAKLADGNVTTLKIADGNITRLKLADKVVGAGQLDDAAVGQSHHQDNGIPSRAIGDNVILQRHMSDNSVGSAEIQAGAVQNQHLSPGSITADKVSGSLITDVGITAEFDKRGINVQRFGAKGDGVTDDTAAVKNAIQAGINTNTPVFIPPGTYILDSAQLYFEDMPQTGVTIFGAGKSSVIKRKSNSINLDHQSIFRFRALNNQVEKVSISNLSINSNATNNPIPSGQSDFFYEHCADIYLDGVAGKTIKHVEIENLWCEDAVADHIYFSGVANCYVETANISNMYVSYRNRMRSDITVTGGLAALNINNFIGTKIEVELNSPYDGVKPMQLNISNAYVSQMLDIGGNGDTLNIELVNVNSMGHTNFSSSRGTVSNSTLYFGSGSYGAGLANYRFNYLRGLHFVGCDFYVKPNEITKACIPLYFQSDPTAGIISSFNECRFILDTTLPDTFTGRIIETVAWSALNDINLSVLKISNSKFEGKMERNIHLNRSGHAFLINNDYNATLDAVYTRSDVNNVLVAVIEGGNYRRLAGKQIHIEASGVNQPTIEFKNVSLESARAALNNTASGYLNAVIKGNRLVYFASTPSGGALVGDIGQLAAPLNGQAYRWIATTSHPTAATWVMLEQSGVKKDTTANRPTPNAIDIGLRYLDTTLDPDGKPITWTGTAWVDATGLIV